VGEDRVVPEHELLLWLQELDGPVTTTLLIDTARRSGASAAVIATLERLPAQEWSSAEDAVAAIGTGWSLGSGPAG